jgi:ribosome maturation factor RimP
MNGSPQIAGLVGQVVAAAGLELVKLEFKGDGGQKLLRVYVDQPGGVGLADCERASRALSAALDEREAAGEPTLPGPFTLEVSSPGLDRPLVKPQDYERFAGQRARLKTRTPVAESCSWTGILEGLVAGDIRLRPEAKGAATLTIAFDNIERAQLAPLWPAPQKPGRSRKRG